MFEALERRGIALAFFGGFARGLPVGLCRFIFRLCRFTLKRSAGDETSVDALLHQFHDVAHRLAHKLEVIHDENFFAAIARCFWRGRT